MILKHLRAFSRHNVLVKSIALVLAILLWSYIVGEETQETERVVPLELIVPDDRTVVSRSAESLFVTVRGSRSDIDLLDTRPLSCRYTIGEETPVGRYVFEVTRRHIRTPSGIRVVSIKPSVLDVVLDRLMTKRLMVKPNLHGKSAEGYHVQQEKIKVNPDAVLITGPEGVLGGLNFVLTERISLVGQTRPFFRRVGLEPVQGEKRLRQTMVDVTVPVEPALGRHVISDVPVRVLFSGTGSLHARTEPDRVGLVVTGSEKEIRALESGGLVAYVDVFNLQKGRYELPLKLDLPEGVALVSEQPVITVTLGEDLASPLLAPVTSGSLESDIELGE